MKVIKRNGQIQEFNSDKIVIAVNKALQDVGDTFTSATMIAELIIKDFAGLEEVSIEKIQDQVEHLLMDMSPDAAKAYILYRDQRARDRANPWSDNDERQDMILQKYLKPGETKKQFLDRISLGNDNLRKIFRKKEAIWGGRNLYAIGRPGNITGSNCYVTADPQDNLEDIYRADYEIAKTYAYGGGQGMNLSNIRPKGMKVNNTSSTTPGPMIFAEKYSHTTLNTQQESRRGALMLVMNIEHPDIIDFITAKLDLNKINGANISIGMSDDFMKKYEEQALFITEFNAPSQTLDRSYEARELMEAIGYSAHTMGDPGILFLDRVNKYHLLSEYDDVKFTATNPCGEQPLTAYGSCNLASVNLNAFVRYPYVTGSYFDYTRFGEVVTHMIWGLDDLLDLLGDRHPLPQQREHVKKWREVGLGVMGLADLALSLGLPYGSDLFLMELDRIMRFMINKALQASALRAKEKGVFEKYDYQKIRESSFYRSVVDSDTDHLIAAWGLRNSRLISIAPTGSISNILGVSGGVEPFFQLNYTRRIISLFESERTITVWEKAPLAMAKARGIDVEDLPEWAKITSQNINIDNRIKVQATIQKYVDTAISSTFNLPNSASVKDVIDVYTKAWKNGLKGVTIFRDRCAKIGILAGINADTKDDNPATPPTLKIQDKIYYKHSGEYFIRGYNLTVGVSNKITNLLEREVCPVCGAPLIKKGGCTACSFCDYEKCAI